MPVPSLSLTEPFNEYITRAYDLDYSPQRLREPVGYAIIPRGDTERKEHQHGMNSVAEREYRSRTTTHVLYKHVHLSRFSVVCELMRMKTLFRSSQERRGSHMVLFR